MKVSQEVGDLLIVDDNPLNLNVLRDTLEHRGHRVRCALDGEMALTGVATRVPDLIMLDIMMPVQDGYEVCGKLKADPKTVDVPVIFISALGEIFDKVKAFQVGGVDYITKPFHAEEVYARIDTHLRLYRVQTELERFNRLLAHDLKNPLQIISAASDMLEMDIGEGNEDVTSIKAGVTRALEITDSLLLFAQADRQSVEPEPLDMGAIVDDVRTDLKALLESYKATMESAGDWPVVLGHRGWVRQIWTNYISNAIKYGGRPPRIQLGHAPDDKKMHRFCVVDNGKGIAPDQLSTLFREFNRLGRDDNAGHGIGLAIVRRLADRLGGHAGATSKIGEGSEFYFTLPLADEG